MKKVVVLRYVLVVCVTKFCWTPPACCCSVAATTFSVMLAHEGMLLRASSKSGADPAVTATLAQKAA
jgi:hypothetical protein